MKYICILLITLLATATSYAQELKPIVVKTNVSEATVFINGAQVLRRSAVNIPAGKSVLKISQLSPYVDAKSIQVKLAGSVMVLGVNYQSSVVEALQKLSDDKLQEIDDKYQANAKQIKIEKANQSIIKDEIDFLNENKKIGGANTGVSLLSLKETATYYRERMTALKMKDIELTKKIYDLELEAKLLANQKLQEPDNKPTPMGEILIEVDAKSLSSVNLELTYYVNNAGWYPSYDIRATNIEQPIELLYKANIQQNTKEDWNNVKLSVSSANPNLGNVAPKLKTYFLDYHITPPRYNVENESNEVRGIVIDQGNEPLIGAAISIPGTTIGTTSDIDGKFSLAIPRNGKNITIAYLGYVSQTLPISNSHMTIRLQEDHQELSEVVVVGYGSSAKKQLTGSVSSVRASSEKGQRNDIALPTVQVENQTAVEFAVKIPYTIKSGNKNTLIEIERYALPAQYEYYTIPKINKNAYLLANISDWEQYNLLEGEANIFFEDTYIGKTVLDTRYTSDTLNISLGRDKNIQINRESVKEYTTKKFLSSKREETRAWKISLRNNKSQTVNLTVLDQLPISRRNEIEVSAENTSNAIVDSESGEVKWQIVLAPAQKREIDLRYKVKYPNNRSLYIE